MRVQNVIFFCSKLTLEAMIRRWKQVLEDKHQGNYIDRFCDKCNYCLCQESGLCSFYSIFAKIKSYRVILSVMVAVSHMWQLSTWNVASPHWDMWYVWITCQILMT